MNEPFLVCLAARQVIITRNIHNYIVIVITTSPNAECKTFHATQRQPQSTFFVCIHDAYCWCDKRNVVLSTATQFFANQ